LHAAPNELGRTRVGIAVGRRVGKAVVRNRVKRRIREAVRERLRELAPGYDLVVVARPPAAEAPWPALRSAVEELLRRARILSNVSQV
jgi:ribonuclease P protein component